MEYTTPDINKAAIYSEPGVSLKTDIVERPVETPGPGDILVRLYVISWLIQQSHTASVSVKC